MTRNSINAAVFDEACSPEETKHVKLQINHNDRWEGAKQALNGEEKCVVVDDWLLDWKCVLLFFAFIRFVLSQV